ncbi:hypothetical protein AKJ16_DCAP08609 [Drosera capensis]
MEFLFTIKNRRTMDGVLPWVFHFDVSSCLSIPRSVTSLYSLVLFKVGMHPEPRCLEEGTVGGACYGMLRDTGVNIVASTLPADKEFRPGMTVQSIFMNHVPFTALPLPTPSSPPPPPRRLINSHRRNPSLHFILFPIFLSLSFPFRSLPLTISINCPHKKREKKEEKKNQGSIYVDPIAETGNVVSSLIFPVEVTRPL